MGFARQFMSAVGAVEGAAGMRLAYGIVAMPVALGSLAMTLRGEFVLSGSFPVELMHLGARWGPNLQFFGNPRADQASMNRKLLFSSIIALVLALAIPGSLHAQSATPGKAQMGKMPAGMMEGCEAMKAQKQKMQADMKAQDTQLLGDITQLKTAPDKQKVSLIAGVLSRMVEQRLAMDERKAQMEQQMMQHMMQHMQMGKESMAGCPMMKGPMMHGMPKAGEAPHEHPGGQK